MSDIRHDAATMRLMKHYGFSRQNAATIAWAVLQEADAAVRPRMSGERAEAGFDALRALDSYRVATRRPAA